MNFLLLKHIDPVLNSRICLVISRKQNLAKMRWIEKIVMMKKKKKLKKQKREV